MPPNSNKKRPNEGGADDARPQKRISQGAAAPSSNSASAEEFDLPALASLADASRRYDEWKGDIGDGIHRTFSGGGALFPTNYKLYLKHRAPWACPLVNCRKSFPQCSNLGHHFSKAHRGLKLYDDAKSGLFHPQGMRTKPDKDGRLRPIVVARGFGAPGDDRQATAAPVANRPATANSAPARPLSTQVVSAAAPASTTTRAVNSSVPTPITPAQAVQTSSRNVIDISSDDEDEQLVLKKTLFRNTITQGSTQREQTRAGNNTGGAARSTLDDIVREIIPDLETDFFETFDNFEFEVDDPQPAGGTHHAKNISASWKREDETQRSKVSSKSKQEASAQRPKEVSSGLDRNVDTPCPKNVSSKSRQEADAQHPKSVFPKSKKEIDARRPVDVSSRANQGVDMQRPTDLPPKLNSEPGNQGVDMQRPTDLPPKLNSEPGNQRSGGPKTWRYLMKFLKPGMCIPEDAALKELLTVPQRRELPKAWQYRLRSYEELPPLVTLTAVSLYLCGDESPSSPCSFVGCKEGAEGVKFGSSEFKRGRRLDPRFIFPQCVILPRCLLESDAVLDRLGQNVCCNAFFRRSRGEGPTSTRGHGMSQNKEVMAASSCTSRKKENVNLTNTTSKEVGTSGTKSNTKPNVVKLNHATITSKSANHLGQSSALQALRHVGTPPSSTNRNEEQKSKHSRDSSDRGQSSQTGTAKSTVFSQLAIAMQQTVSPRRATQAHSAQRLVTENTENKPKSERSPVGSESGHTGENNPETLRSGCGNEGQGVKLTSREKKHLWMNGKRRKIKEKRMKRKAKRWQEGQAGVKQHSPTSQAQATPVSAAAASLSNLAVNDTPTAPSRSQQQDGPEPSHKTTIFTLANGSSQCLGFTGGETQLLQASKRQTLECEVWAGSVRVKMIGKQAMVHGHRMYVGESWTVDGHCLVSNFFPTAQETAVINIRSKPVKASKE